MFTALGVSGVIPSPDRYSTLDAAHQASLNAQFKAVCFLLYNI